jgi:hypothetical protein
MTHWQIMHTMDMDHPTYQWMFRTSWYWLCLQHFAVGCYNIYLYIKTMCLTEGDWKKFEKIWMGEQKRQHAHESKFKMAFLTNRHMCMMELISSTCGFWINNWELNNMHCCLHGAAVKDTENLPTKHLILSCTCSGVLRSTESCTSFLQDNVFCMHLLKPKTLQPKHIGAS